MLSRKSFIQKAALRGRSAYWPFYSRSRKLFQLLETYYPAYE